MPQQVADRKDQDFVIWEQLNCEEILKHEIFHEFNKKTCNMIITEARALAVNELLPLLAEQWGRPIGDAALLTTATMVPLALGPLLYGYVLDAATVADPAYGCDYTRDPAPFNYRPLVGVPACP